MNKILNQQTIKDGSFVGSTDLTDVTAEELSIMGSLKFHNLTVTGDMDILGPIQNSQNGTFKDVSILGSIDASAIMCRDLDVTGSVKVAGLTVTGDANILGNLEIKSPKISNGSNILQNLEISAESIALEDTVINGNIIIQPTIKNRALKWFKKETLQVLHLQGNTTVKGDITFKSGNGKTSLAPQQKLKEKSLAGTSKKTELIYLNFFRKFEGITQLVMTKQASR